MALREKLEALRDFDSALLANTMDYFDPTPTAQCYLSGEIQSVTPTLGPAVGAAVTMQMDSSTPDGVFDNDSYWQFAEQMEGMEEPSILVIQVVGSRPEHECVAGDGMAKTLLAAGCVGLVTNGRVRDVAALHTVPFSIHAAGRCVQHCAIRVKAINEPVEVGGLTISPGDILHAGADGVLRLPHSALDNLIEGAPKLAFVEHLAHSVLRRTDASVAEKRKAVDHIYRENGLTRKSEI